jgi:hypothetical protein
MIVLLALVAEIPILLMRRPRSGADSTCDTGAIGSVLGTGGKALAALGAGSNVSDGGVFDGGSGSGAGAGGAGAEGCPPLAGRNVAVVNVGQPCSRPHG